MKRYLIIIALLALGACAGDAATRATNALATVCDSHASVLKQLTPYKAKMSPGNVAKVDASVTIARPVCSKDAVVDPKTAIGVAQSALDMLNQVKDSL